VIYFVVTEAEKSMWYVFKLIFFRT